MKKIGSWLLTLVLILSLIGSPVIVNAAGKKEVQKQIVLYTGQKKQLKNAKVNEKKAVWKVKNKKIVKLSKNGKIVGNKSGKTTVYAKYNGKTYTWKVVVKKPCLQVKKLALNVGETKQLKLLGAKIKKCKSTNKKVVSVSTKGKVKALLPGKAEIKVTGKNGKQYTCKVTVTSEKATTTTEETTTDKSEITTEKLEITTEKPETTTEKPETTTTEKPVETTTEKPAATTEKPVETTTEKPAATTEKPVEITTEKPAATTEKPAATTEKPVETTTEKLATTTEKPVETTTEKPAATTEKPTEATTEKPETTTETTEQPTEPAGDDLVAECKQELRTMLLTADFSEHDFSKYNLTYPKLDKKLEELRQEDDDVDIISSCYGTMFFDAEFTPKYVITTTRIYDCDREAGKNVTSETILNRYTETKRKVNEILAFIKEHPEMSEMDKVLYAHEYIADYASYKDTGYIAHEAGGILGENMGVCEGYAEAMCLVLKRMGIDVMYMSSNAMNHGWNYVKVDDEWYHVDLCWDDKTSTIDHTYLIRNDAQFNTDIPRKHFSWRYGSFNEPQVIKSTSTKYNDWFVHDIEGKMIYKNGYWYYQKDKYVMKAKLDGSYNEQYKEITDMSGFKLEDYID